MVTYETFCRTILFPVNRFLTLFVNIGDKRASWTPRFPSPRPSPLGRGSHLPPHCCERGFCGAFVSAAIEKVLHERIAIISALGCSGNNRRHRRGERNEDGLRMRQLADFGRRKGNALPRRDESEQSA